MATTSGQTPPNDTSASSSSPSSNLPLFLPPEASLLPNQSVVQPPPPSHFLSAADDLVGRFELNHSYRVMLHPFRRDLNRHKQSNEDDDAADAPASKHKSGADATASPAAALNSTDKATAASHDAQQAPQLRLPLSYAHFLPHSLPGRVKPPRLPRRNHLAVVRRMNDGTITDEKSALKAQAEMEKVAEWDKFKNTLRKAVFKEEFTSVELRPFLDEEAIKGYQGLQAGDVSEIDRSLLESDAAGGPPKKKKKRSGAVSGGAGPATSTAATAKAAGQSGSTSQPRTAISTPRG